MAYYAYKHVRDLLPKHIIDAQGPDYQGDGNYDGDQWYAAEDYIRELIDQRDTARAELAKLANAELPKPVNQGLLDALKGMVQLDIENHQRGGGDIDVCKEVMDAYAAIAAAEAHTGEKT